MVSAVLTAEGREFTGEELFPVREIKFQDEGQCGAAGPVRIALRSGRTVCVDYEGLEGNLSL